MIPKHKTDLEKQRESEMGLRVGGGVPQIVGLRVATALPGIEPEVCEANLGLY